MFSYRHVFHAGNHADVLKHAVLLHIIHYLTHAKETPLHLLDTHAGAGLYRLDSAYAQTSLEAKDGIERLLSFTDEPLTPLLQEYVQAVMGFNAENADSLRIYPGSPFLMFQMLRQQDRLKLFELHPTDMGILEANVEQLHAKRQITVLREDGFQGVLPLLPPPSRRGFLLCDPSYEVKSDYAKVLQLAEVALKRFNTGCYMIWYPVIGRLEAYDLPRSLKTLCKKAKRNWLCAELTVKSGKNATGLPASGVFVVNPPYTLKEALSTALPQMVRALAQDKNAHFSLESSE